MAAATRTSSILVPVRPWKTASVTVVARDGGMADALETTVYIMGPERGLKLVDETPGAAAIFVRLTPEGIETFESSRFKEIPRTDLKDLGPGAASSGN